MALDFLSFPQNFEAAVKNIVKQSFPSASGSVLSLQATEPQLAGTIADVSTRISGGHKELFVWGYSRMGGSRIVGSQHNA